MYFFYKSSIELLSPSCVASDVTSPPVMLSSAFTAAFFNVLPTNSKGPSFVASPYPGKNLNFMSNVLSGSIVFEYNPADELNFDRNPYKDDP